MVRAGPERPLTLALHAVTLSPHFMEAVQLLLLVLRKVETGLAAAQAARALEQALSLPSPPAADPGPAISHPAHAHAHGPRAAAIVHAMLGQVRDHYQRPLDLSHLAEALGRNPSYLSTVFAAHMGVPFHRYLCEFRLIKAMELLRDPLRLISDISAATGHASPNHFNNLFKSLTGLSPSAWRAANTTSGAPVPPKSPLRERRSKES
jgi:transcriptional regulator GlxA family with amidase domain